MVYEVDFQIISQKQIITSPGLISLAFFVYSKDLGNSPTGLTMLGRIGMKNDLFDPDSMYASSNIAISIKVLI